MATIADLDTHCFARIIDMCGPFGALGLRGSCREMRARMPAPRHITARKLWRWAKRRERADLMEIACDEGARQLVQFAPECFSFEIARPLWIEQFATIYVYNNGHVCDDAELHDVSAIIRGDEQAIARICGSRIVSAIVAHYIGKHASDAQIRAVFDRVVTEARADVGDEYAPGIGDCAEMLAGVARAGRLVLASSLISDIVALARDGVIANVHEHASCLFDFLLGTDGCVGLCEQLGDLSRNVSEAHMYNAARSGSRAACEYVYDRISDDLGNFRAAPMIAGAIDCESIELFDLALEWIDNASAAEAVINPFAHRTWETCIVPYSIEDGGEAGQQLRLAGTALVYATHRRSRKMCEYARAWFKSLAKRALVCEPEDVLGVLYSRGGTYDAHVRCLMFANKCARTRVAQRKLEIPPYDAMFARAMRRGAYWLADLAIEWAREDGVTCDISSLRANDHDLSLAPARTLTTAVIRARFIREARAALDE